MNTQNERKHDDDNNDRYIIGRKAPKTDILTKIFLALGCCAFTAHTIFILLILWVALNAMSGLVGGRMLPY